MIQERYPCATVGNTSAVKVYLHMHICLLGHSLNLSDPRRPCGVSGRGGGAAAADAGGGHNSRRPEAERETARPSGESEDPTAIPPQGFWKWGGRRVGYTGGRG